MIKLNMLQVCYYYTKVHLMNMTVTKCQLSDLNYMCTYIKLRPKKTKQQNNTSFFSTIKKNTVKSLQNAKLFFRQNF